MAKDAGEEIRKEIDRIGEREQGDGFRGHLGASQIGKKCIRQIWYSFRWAKTGKHKARTLRIWQRGHDEEPRLIALLRGIGAVVEDCDPSTGEQFRIIDHDGHFGGSCDGKVRNLARFGLEGEGLLEMKTMGDKYFKQLVEKGLALSNVGYYAQMQVYMHYLGLRWGLFVAVNKNDDELHFVVVPYKREVAERYRDIAAQVIEAHKPPPRISEDSSWWVCKFCDYREICHHEEPPSINCRSCAFASPVEDGQWRCAKHEANIPKDFLRKACGSWDPIA
jgi:hypothetical protein